MSNNDFRYIPLSKTEYEYCWEKHKNIIGMFLKNNRFNEDSIYINKSVVLSIIAKVDQRKKYFQYFHGLDMSEFKETSLICFWYIKLKPISIVTENNDLKELSEFEAINEKLALYYILSTYRSLLCKEGKSTEKLDNLPQKYIDEVLYSFEFRDISKEAFVLLVESIAVFLGLDPYKSSL